MGNVDNSFTNMASKGSVKTKAHKCHLLGQRKDLADRQGMCGMCEELSNDARTRVEKQVLLIRRCV